MVLVLFTLKWQWFIMLKHYHKLKSMKIERIALTCMTPNEEHKSKEKPNVEDEMRQTKYRRRRQTIEQQKHKIRGSKKWSDRSKEEEIEGGRSQSKRDH